ncbi:MAG TPA: carbohydrate-binding domain-containing protein [Bacteroidales bacterium]|nr:carbohydrate-binding domain-containing protein [Bacteroidales bacterium]
MKKVVLFILIVAGSIQAFSQSRLFIHKQDNITLGVPTAMTDSIYFSSNGLITYFRIGDTLVQYNTSAIDSLTFGDNANTIYIKYNGSGVSVINPLAFEGVSVAVTGADVIIHSTTETQDLNYNLSGSTTNGMFKIYSEKRYNLILNGVTITNPDGPAINLQSEKKASVELVTGKVNMISDGATYAPAPLNGSGNPEDQKGTFFSEGKLVVGGSGSLSIACNGSEQHALCSDDLIEITGGNITVTKATVDGIHGQDGIEISGGTLNVTSGGDAIDAGEAYINISGGSVTTLNSQAETKGITCDSSLTITGGTLNLSVSGSQSKALQCTQAMTLSGGAITINNSGSVALVATGAGFNPVYCCAVKSSTAVNLAGANLTITSSNSGAKSISCDGNISMTAGTVNITNSGAGARYLNSQGVYQAYVPTCFSADGNITITDGSITTSSSGAGGRGIAADGELTVGSTATTPVISVTTTGTKVYISGSGNNSQYAEAKAITCDGDITFESGTITISSADDGIKSTTAATFNNASITISNSVEGIEAPYITINGGVVNAKSTDDCMNATFGNGGENNDGSLLKVTGGTLVANASGNDCLDSNGSMLFTGGLVIGHGPQSAPEVGMDFNGTCKVNGGFLVVSGTNSNMTEPPSSSSTQRCVLAKTNSSIPAGSMFHVQDAAGNDIVSFSPIRSYYSVIFSSSALQNGTSYSIYTGGSYSGGTNNNGYWSGGTYSGGTFKKTFTINNIITSVTF